MKQLFFIFGLMIFGLSEVSVAQQQRELSVSERQRALKAQRRAGLERLAQTFPGMRRRVADFSASLSAVETAEGLTKPIVRWLIGPTGTGKTFFIDMALEYAGIPSDRDHRHRVTDKNDVALDFEGVIDAERPVEGTSQLQAVLFYDEVLQLRPFAELNLREAMARAESILSMDTLLAEGRHEISRENFLGGVNLPRSSRGDPFTKVADILKELIKEWITYKEDEAVQELVALQTKKDDLTQKLELAEPAANAKKEALLVRYKKFRETYQRWSQLHDAWDDERIEAATNDKKFTKPAPVEPKWTDIDPEKADLTDFSDEYKSIYQTRSGVTSEIASAQAKLSKYRTFIQTSTAELVNLLQDIRRFFPRYRELVKTFTSDQALAHEITHDDKKLAKWLLENPREAVARFDGYPIPEVIKLPRNNIIIYFAGNPNEILKQARERFLNYEGEKTPNAYRKILAEIGTPEKVQEEVTSLIGINQKVIDVYIEQIRSGTLTNEVDQQGNLVAPKPREVPKVLLRLQRAIPAMLSRYAIDSIELELPPTDEEYREIIRAISRNRLGNLKEQYRQLQIDFNLSEAFEDWLYFRTVDPLGSLRFTAEYATTTAQLVLSSIETKMEELVLEHPHLKSVRISVDVNANESESMSTINFAFAGVDQNKKSIELGSSQIKVKSIQKSWESSRPVNVVAGPRQSIYHQMGHIFGSLIEFGSFPTERLDWTNFDSTQSFGKGTIFNIGADDGIEIDENLNLIRVLLYGHAFEKLYDSLTPGQIVTISASSDLDLRSADARLKDLIRQARTADFRDGHAGQTGPNLNRLLQIAGVGAGDIAIDDYSYENAELSQLLIHKLKSQVLFRTQMIKDLSAQVFKVIYERYEQSGNTTIYPEDFMQVLEERNQDGVYRYHSFNESFVQSVRETPAGSLGPARGKIDAWDLRRTCFDLLDELLPSDLAGAIKDAADRLL